MRTVFLGTPRAAVPALEALLEADQRPALVICQPDRAVGRSAALQAPPVKRAALAAELPLFQPTRVRNAAFRERLSAAAPELLVVVAYGRILPRPVLDLAPHGAINLHFSLLPRYRGAAPVQWALARGESATGVTTMQINERLDEGDLLLQEEVAIHDAEHAPELSERLARVGARLLVETLDRLQGGGLVPRPQDHDRATFAPPLSRSDGEPQLTLTADELAGRIRGFDPWPGVWVRRGRRRIRLVEGQVLGGRATDAPPGTVLEADDIAAGIPLACGAGTRFLIRAIQPEGGRVLTMRDAVNGRHLGAGDRLESAAAKR